MAHTASCWWWIGRGGTRASGFALPEGLTLWLLPAYTPQLNPAERLWPLVREAVANWPCGRREELEQIVGQRCVTLHDDPVQMCRATNYHWWPWC